MAENKAASTEHLGSIDDWSVEETEWPIEEKGWTDKLRVSWARSKPYEIRYRDIRMWDLAVVPEHISNKISILLYLMPKPTPEQIAAHEETARKLMQKRKPAT